MKRVLLFFVLSCALSWPLAALIASKTAALPMGVVAFLYMCGPGFAGIIMAMMFHKGERLAVLGLRFPPGKRGWLWLILAYLCGMAVILGSLCLSLLGPEVSLQSPSVGTAAMMEDLGQNPGLLDGIPALNLLLIAQWAVLAPLLNIPLMLSEELGWRGWLWSALRPRGFWIATGLTGLLWGLWHVPIIALGHNYPGMPIWGPIVFTIFCILYAPLFSLVREKTDSVWGPCVLHATTNGAAAISIVMLTNPPMLWKGLIGIGGFVMMAISAALIARFYRPAAPAAKESVTPAA